MSMVDLLANCIMCMLVGVMIGIFGYRTICALLTGVLFLAILANLILLAGLGKSCRILIGVWQVMMFLYIVLLLVGWVLIPFIVAIDYYPFFVEEPDKLDFEIEIDLPPLSYVYWGVIMLTMLILPIYYSYYWIVVNSYRKHMLARRHRFTPAAGGRSNNAFVIHNTPRYLPYEHGYSLSEHGKAPVTATHPPPPINVYGEPPPPFSDDDVSISQPSPQIVFSEH